MVTLVAFAVVLCVLYTCILVELVSITLLIVLGELLEIAQIIVGEAIVKLKLVELMILAMVMAIIKSI